MVDLCEQCAYYIYDEEYEEYLCDMAMDEDDFHRIAEGSYRACPFFRDGNEYLIARRQ